MVAFMKCKIIRKNVINTGLWSGGSTSQLYMYPENGDYGTRNFQWRISTATVEVEKSNFTKLPGVNRILMILDGQLALEHRGHHKINLKPLEQDYFQGDWETTSFGRVTDFNLMFKEGYSGKVVAFDDKAAVDLSKHYAITGETSLVLYIYKGSFTLKDMILESGDVLVISDIDTGSLDQLHVLGRGTLITSYVEVD